MCVCIYIYMFDSQLLVGASKSDSGGGCCWIITRTGSPHLCPQDVLKFKESADRGSSSCVNFFCDLYSFHYQKILIPVSFAY